MNLHLRRGVFSGLISNLLGYIRGSIIRGGIAAWEVYNAKTAGQILVGDGVDISSVPISGDATLTSDGVLRVDFDKIVTAEITTFPTVVISRDGNVVVSL